MPPPSDHGSTRDSSTAREDTIASFQFHAVDAPLGLFVSYLYVSFVPGPFMACNVGHRVPELEPQLVFVVEEGSEFPGGVALGDGRHAALFLQPAHLRTVEIPTTIRAAVGASLRPEGLRLLMPGAADDLEGEPRIPLELLWGARGRDLLEQLVVQPSAERRVALLRNTLTERALRLAAPNATARHAVRLIERAHGDVLVERVAAECGVTSRALHKSVTNQIGLTPKQVARIARMRRALELVRAATDSLSSISAVSAFSDQAHLSREFRELLGVTPRDLVRQLRARQARRPDYTSETELLGTGLLLVPRSDTST